MHIRARHSPRARWWVLAGIGGGVILAAPAGFLGAALPLPESWVSGGMLVVALGLLGAVIACAAHRRRVRAAQAPGVNDFRGELERRLAIRDAMISGLARLADYRESENGRHVDRMSEYATLLARRLARLFPEISDDWIRNLQVAASLHDIGKFGIPDSVLLKAGSLDQDERDLVERHTGLGADTLLDIRRRLGHDPLMDMSVQVALEHHEWWDGTGYPLGMRGDQIPLAARIVALADAYDALTSQRTYRGAMSHADAAITVARGRGTQFDPRVCDAFLAAADEFNAIRTRVREAQMVSLRRVA